MFWWRKKESDFSVTHSLYLSPETDTGTIEKGIVPENDQGLHRFLRKIYNEPDIPDHPKFITLTWMDESISQQRGKL